MNLAIPLPEESAIDLSDDTILVSSPAEVLALIKQAQQELAASASNRPAALYHLTLACNLLESQ